MVFEQRIGAPGAEQDAAGENAALALGASVAARAIDTATKSPDTRQGAHRIDALNSMLKAIRSLRELVADDDFVHFLELPSQRSESRSARAFAEAATLDRTGKFEGYRSALTAMADLADSVDVRGDGIVVVHNQESALLLSEYLHRLAELVIKEVDASEAERTASYAAACA